MQHGKIAPAEICFSEIQKLITGLKRGKKSGEYFFYLVSSFLQQDR